MNQGFCPTCNELVDARPVEREGKVFLVKSCPKCGSSEALISGDAARYAVKRQLDVPFQYGVCRLNCTECRHKKPNIVFVDITNRCNLNCPICINNTPSMGFLFEPPMEYFERIFQHFSAYSPRPSIQLFGGEPTVRNDLLDIIRMARSYGLATRVVTNGLKLADEDYCRKLIETRATILIAYDGANPEAYRILRGSEKCLELKQKAIENLVRIGGAKVTLMTLAAKGFNDHELPELFAYCHERRQCIRAVYFMPLAHTWKREDFDLEPERITSEDIENIVAAAFPEDPVEFIPAGFLGQLPALMKCLRVKPMPFLGAHPNCESLYVLVSDGEKFVPLARYLKSSFPAVGQALLEADQRLGQRMARMETGLWGRFLGRIGLRKKVLHLRAMLAVYSVLRRHGRLGRVLKGKGLGKVYHAIRIPLDLLLGRRTQRTFDAHTAVHGFLQLIVLPFEDRYTLETERMERCPSGFAYVDPADGEVRHVPACAWGIHKTATMRAIMDHYAAQESVRA